MPADAGHLEYTRLQAWYLLPETDSQCVLKQDDLRRNGMTRVLLVGLQPEAVDYSDPALPPGMDARKIQAGIELGLKQMTDRGWQANECLIQPDATAGPTVDRRLGATTYDFLCNGAGVRLPAITYSL